MKTIAWILLIAGAMLAGCKQPSDIELLSDEAESNLTINAVSIPDSNIALTSIDSLAILPQDQVDFKGQVIINRVTYDIGTASKTVAYAQVFLADSTVRFVNRLVGFAGLDLGMVALNGNPMVKIPHRISLPRWFGLDSSIVRGVTYLADLTGTFTPDRDYTWTMASFRYGVQTFSISAPEQLDVLSPRGGAVVARSSGLVLNWKGGKGKVAIILSAYDPVAKKARPLLDFRVKANIGRAVIPAQILRQLPANRYFVLTFILGNRKEVTLASGQGPANVLIQAASVYNTYVEIR